MTLSVALLPRDVLQVSGRDALSFLDSQLSQSLQTVGEGQGAASFLLQPDGKVVDLIGVHRRGDEVLLDVDRSARELVEQRLRRFLFRVEVVITQADLNVAWWPEGAMQGNALSVRTFGKSGQLALCEALPDGVHLLSDAEMHHERLLQEIPFYGTEITDRTIPAALGTGIVASAVSFTKGCYTGQELVARLDARGSQVPFHLAALRAGVPLKMGDALLARPDGPNGIVTSVTTGDDGRSWFGLGFVHRSHIDGDGLRLPSGEEVQFEVLEGTGTF
jgi:folate-binding protein YgfZ